MPAWWSCSRQRDGKGKVGRSRIVVQVLALRPRFVSTGPRCLVLETESRSVPNELGRPCAPSTPEWWHVKAKNWPQTAKKLGLGHAISQPRPTRSKRRGV